MEYTKLAVLLVLVTLSAGCIFDSSPQQTETKVTEVVDGDTVRVGADASETIRIIGIDTPETRGAVSPNEFGLSNTTSNRACLRQVATDATERVQTRVGGSVVTLEADALSDNRGSYGRLLRYVEVNSTDLGEELVREGYARIYEAEAFTREGAYMEATKEAEANSRGYWKCNEERANGVTIPTIHEDAAGDDRMNLNDEYIVIKNNEDTPINTSGWSVSDDSGKTYALPNRTIEPQNSVTIRTGAGEDTAKTLYWNSSSPVWNNNGDTVTVGDENGSVVAQRAY